MAMTIVTLVLGDLLVVLGILGYFLPEKQSLTALIPAGFGVAFNMFGALGFLPNLRKHVMHGAVGLAVLGVLGTLPMALPKLFALVGGGEVERQFAVVAQTVMGVLCLIYVIIAVMSFAKARQRQALEQASPGDGG